MYYLVYALLYLISLLPFFILYGLSDLMAFILYRVVRYRVHIVDQNLCIAFPDRSPEERKRIAGAFYRNFTDNFIETIKLLSISPAEFDRRIHIDASEVNALAAQGKNIQFNSGHQMNWEWASLSISKHLNLPWLAVYKRIASKPAERLFLKIRSRFGAVMVALEDYASRMPGLMKKQYALGLIADQNPAFAHNAYWLNFFSKPAPFLTGTEKGARRNRTAVVFVDIQKIKRGYYNLVLQVVSEDAGEFGEGTLTRMYRDFLEAGIRQTPATYLWSHRRWKHTYKGTYKRKWLDA